MPDFSIVAVSVIESREAQQLIGELDRELRQRYPGSSVHSLDLQSVTPENTIFLVGYLDGAAVACGAIRKIGPGTGEVKRVYVKPAVRGQGLSKLILRRLEDEARRAGLVTLKLETGTKQPESVGLYRQAGYIDIPKFGEYVDDPYSICMEKQLG
jgi:GNAT superfamily N-acetyltransferase